MDVAGLDLETLWYGAEWVVRIGALAVVPLAGNRLVQLDSPADLVHVIVNGGFAPATATNPRPFGMPPFGATLSDADIAALASMLRNSWGNAAPEVTAVDVYDAR